MTTVRPERIDLQQESPHPPPEPARTLRPGDETTEAAHVPPRGRLRPRTDDLPHRLVRFLTERAGRNALVPLSPEVLELRQEVEVAALENPPSLLHERLDTCHTIRDERDQAVLRVSGQRIEYRPPHHARLMTGEEERLLEHGGVSADGTEQDEVQGVLHALEEEPESIDDRDESPARDRRWREPTEEEGEPADVAAPEVLPTHTPQRSESAETHPVLEPAEGVLQMNAQPLAATPLLSDAPGPFAADALSAASAKMNTPCPTTRRFRVYGVHTREV